MCAAIKLRLGLSPCPNDTFIFHALLHGLAGADAGLEYAPFMADVEKLNSMALGGELEITKISIGVVPHILDKYRLLSSGSALGWACGPLVLAREPLNARRLREARIAIPGKMTTANLLLDLHGGFEGPRMEMLFSDIMDAVERGDADAGVIIHEGRFTWQNRGLCKILDTGEWWEGKFKMPLPLGAIAIRRDVPEPLALAVQHVISQSVDHAWQKPEDSRDFIRQNAREISDEVTKAHIKTFVTDFSRDLGNAGREAIRTLVAQKIKDPDLLGDMFV